MQNVPLILSPKTEATTRFPAIAEFLCDNTVVLTDTIKISACSLLRAFFNGFRRFIIMTKTDAGYFARSPCGFLF